MSSQHKVLILNKPFRIYGFTPPQMGCFVLSFVLALLAAKHLPAWQIAHIPLSFLCGLLLLSIGLTITQATNIRPLAWWRKRLEFAMKALPMYLPDIHVSGDSRGAVLVLPDGSRKVCLKCTGIDLMKLDHVQREDLSSIFSGAVSSSNRVQVVYTTVAGPECAENFYLLIDEPINPLETIALLELAAETTAVVPVAAAEPKAARLPLAVTKLQSSGLQLQPVSKEEIRTILYAHLSPAHFTREEGIPSHRDDVSETLALCKTGFTHHRSYILIDETYCAVLRLSKLPLETYVGWLHSLIGFSGRFTTSLHFEYCNQDWVRRQVQTNIRLMNATRTAQPIGMDGVDQMSRFVQGATAAYDFSCYTAVYATSLPELNASIEKVKQAGSNCGAVLEIADLEQLEALISSLPLGLDDMGDVHRILSPVVGTCWPFLNA